jgi:hypothetical protein
MELDKVIYLGDADKLEECFDHYPEWLDKAFNNGELDFIHFINQANELRLQNGEIIVPGDGLVRTENGIKIIKRG